MAEQEVAVVRDQQDKQKGLFRVAVPLRDAARVLRLRKGQQMRVIIDEARRRIIYEPIG